MATTSQVTAGGPIEIAPGMVFTPGPGKVFAVHATGPSIYRDMLPGLISDFRTSVNAALALCQANRGDTVLVLPGHTESVSTPDAWSNLVANTQIVGLGRGRGVAPTFTWTAADATVLLNVAGCSLRNLRLNMSPEAATNVTVAAPITVSAEGCSILDCFGRVGTDADSNVTIAITTTTDANDFLMENVLLEGATASECTTVLQLVGADRAVLRNVRIFAATSAVAVGVVRFLTTASTDVIIDGCLFANNKALSEQAITGMAGISGFMDNTHMAVLSNAAGALTGAFSTPASFNFGLHCGITNLAGETAALFGTVSA